MDPGKQNMSRVLQALLVAVCATCLSTPLRASEPTTAPQAAPASPEAIVDAQLEAYNERDLDAFLASYSEDVVLATYPNVVTQTGKAEMRARYAKSFANPNVRAEILRRIVLGNTVIDHERITAPPAKGQLEAVAIYEIAGGKIVRVTFVEDAPRKP